MKGRKSLHIVVTLGLLLSAIFQSTAAGQSDSIPDNAGDKPDRLPPFIVDTFKPVTPVIPDIPITPVDPIDKNDPLTPTVNPSNPGIPKVTSDKSVGTTSSSLSVNAMGAAEFSVQFRCPEGGRLSPQTGLAYNSQNASYGLAGYGITVTGLSVITRGEKRNSTIMEQFRA